MDLIEIPRVENVKLYRQKHNYELNHLKTEKLTGSLNLTSHHLIFISQTNPAKPKEEIWVIKYKIYIFSNFMLIRLFTHQLIIWKSILQKQKIS